MSTHFVRGVHHEDNALALLIVVLPQVPVSALARHVKGREAHISVCKCHLIIFRLPSFSKRDNRIKNQGQFTEIFKYLVVRLAKNDYFYIHRNLNLKQQC